MTPPPSAYELSCPYCGARNARGEASCWLCKQPLSLEAAAEPPVLAEAVDARPQFALSTLLLVITVICISAGLVAAAPGFIIPLVVIVLPALVRSIAASRSAGGQLSVGQKVANFVVSLGIVVGIWMAGVFALVTAFALICFGAMSTRFDQSAGEVLSILAIVAMVGALITVLWLYYVTWPSKQKQKQKQNR